MYAGTRALLGDAVTTRAQSEWAALVSGGTLAVP